MTTRIIFALIFHLENAICSPLTQFFVIQTPDDCFTISRFQDIQQLSGELLMMMAGGLGGITIGWRELPTIYFDNLCLLLEHAQTPRATPAPNYNNPRCLTHPPTNNPTMTPSQLTHRAWFAPLPNCMPLPDQADILLFTNNKAGKDLSNYFED